MGLDARVYRKKDNLPVDPDQLRAPLDRVTGEYYFEDSEKQLPPGSLVAVEKRIGNVALVAELRHAAEKVLDQDSVILSRVLYSGTHSGDWIEPQLFGQLEEELLSLRDSSNTLNSSYINGFVSDMSELLEAAKCEGNPIVF